MSLDLDYTVFQLRGYGRWTRFTAVSQWPTPALGGTAQNPH